ncbi:MAG TPA: glycosyltransferase [Abditibacterium sp.]|jgi:spore maturation protein CgeB
MNIAFFGSSLVSAYWNGAATYYRGLLKALHARGHSITFYEPDAYERQQHRDIETPDYARVVVYENDENAAFRALEQAKAADLIVKASGVGVFDELLEAGVLTLKTSKNHVVFWDVDAPATLERVEADAGDVFRALVPRYDAIFTYGGGNPVVSAYQKLGAKMCVPIYNALDSTTHFPGQTDTRFSGNLGFLGNRLPDREARVEAFFLDVAASLPEKQFVLGGSGWNGKLMSENVRYVGHVYTHDHNAFNATPLAVLNIARDSMARFGFSPATRVFEAAGGAACLISDFWEGIEQFFEPNQEILVARDGAEVASILQDLTPERARQIGQNALKRARAEHLYEHRAGAVEAALGIRE